MIFGIITATIFVLCSFRFFTGKLKKGSWIKKLFAAVHKPLGVLFVALAAVHLGLTLPLIRQRSMILYILGMAMLICAITGMILRHQMKDRRKAFLLHEIGALVIVLLLIPHIGFCITGLREYQQKVAAISFSDPAISSVADGEYVGECNVNYIYAKVKVTVRGGAVTNIDLLEHRNERGAAGEKVIDEILQEQRSDVDAVSGATNSSKVIKKAVENALEQGMRH